MSNIIPSLPHNRPDMFSDTSDVTVVLSACNRPHLLRDTLEGFFNLNTYPLKRFIIIDDGMNPGCNDHLLKDYNFPIEVIYNDPKLYQIKSVDAAYAMVETPYIFHMEEDWEFFRPSFIEHSKAVLEADPNILQVWLRGLDDLTCRHPHHEGVYEINGHNLVVLQHTGVWNGFTFNPGLKRLSDWKELPNGYDGCQRYTPAEQSGGVTLESDISIEYAKRGRIAMRFIKSYIRHTGWNDHIIHGVNGE